MNSKITKMVTISAIIVLVAVSLSYAKTENKSELYETYIGDVVADAIRDATGADIGFINAGSLGYENFPKTINEKTVSAIVPFGSDKIVKITMKGSDILQVLEKSYSLMPRKSASFLQVAGLKIVYDLNLPAGKRIIDIKVNGKELKAGGSYEIATTDYLANGGGGLSAFRNGKKTDMKPIELEKAVLDYIDYDVENIDSTYGRILIIIPEN